MPSYKVSTPLSQSGTTLKGHSSSGTHCILVKSCIATVLQFNCFLCHPAILSLLQKVFLRYCPLNSLKANFHARACFQGTLTKTGIMNKNKLEEICEELNWFVWWLESLVTWWIFGLGHNWGDWTISVFGRYGHRESNWSYWRKRR